MTRILSFICAFFIITLSFPAYSADAIGKIEQLKGQINNVATSSPLTQGSLVYLGDSLMTAPESAALIVFDDQTSFTLGENSSIVVDEYIYDPANPESNKAKFKLLKSAFHYTSGQIAKKENPDVTLQLDFGSIGIRGTQIWRDMVSDDQGEMTCRIYVEDGQADVSNDNGKVTLGHGDGTKIHGPNRAPTEVKAWGQAAIDDIKSKSSL